MFALQDFFHFQNFLHQRLYGSVELTSMTKFFGESSTTQLQTLYSLFLQYLYSFFALYQKLETPY
jgi:hypothetical protein